MAPAIATTAREEQPGPRFVQTPHATAGREDRPSAAYVALIVFLVVLIALGGSSRADASQLLVLGPLSALFLTFGLLVLPSAAVRQFFWVYVGFGCAVAIVLVHLIPLPPEIWSRLPGRDGYLRLALDLGVGDIWRPITLVRASTWNALYALVPVAAVLTLVTAALDQERRALNVAMVIVAIATIALELIQAANDGQPQLYTGGPVEVAPSGLFSNPNHQAAFLASLLPMLAVFARSSGSVGVVRGMIAIAAAVMILPLLFLTGSRGGVLAGGIGAVASGLMMVGRSREARVRYSRGTSPRSMMLIGAPLLIAVLAAIGLASARAPAIARLFEQGLTDERRLSALAPIGRIAWNYFPIGSGIGTFPEIFQIHEPRALLKSTYLNHAHNDWLEVIMTAGLPGIALLVAAVIGWTIASVRAWWPGAPGGAGRDLARAGSAIMLIYGFASFADYPLRVPFLACQFVISAIWLAGGLRGGGANATEWGKGRMASAVAAA